MRDLLPISARRRAELKERLTEEEQARERRAAVEEEVLRMDADLRERRMQEARERDESRRRAREEAERQLAEEAEQGSSDPTVPVDVLNAAAAQSYAGTPLDHPAEAEVQAIGRAADAVSQAATAPLPSVTSPTGVPKAKGRPNGEQPR